MAIRTEQVLRRAELAEIETIKRQALAKDPDGLNGQALGLRAYSDVETISREEKGKVVTYARRRPDTVWSRLSVILGPQLVGVGERLTEVYAEMMGLAGAPSDELDGPRVRQSDPTVLPTRMLAAGRLWADIMAGFGGGSAFPAMFTGLCQEIMETEGRVPGQPRVSRWRKIVEGTCRESNRNGQGAVVRLGCMELCRIMDDLDL